MRWSRAYLPTYREVPSDAEIPSHRLMLRAGLVRQLAAGIYNYLPAGYRVLRRIERIVREEMDRAGCQEILMPILHPSELYEETGRLSRFGDLLFQLRDRRARPYALGPTHEEVVTDLARAQMRSYRQLPQCLYQINTKFRDEFRPRFGLMRAREFVMKDAYSFHDSHESLQETYDRMAEAYRRILERCGLEAVMVEADAGAIGGDVNHEFVVLADSGESEIFQCPACGYAANDERAEAGATERPTLPALDAPERVATPGRTRVEDVCRALDARPEHLVKTLLLRAGDRVVAALVPGERELSEAKLARVLGASPPEMLDAAEIERLTGAPVGFAGPVGLPDDVEIVADTLLAGYDGMIVGANAADAHLRGVRMGRDFRPAHTASISIALDGDACPSCREGRLRARRGVELGHIFKLDVKYSEAMGATFLDAEGRERPFIMGCYGFGVSRAVAAAIEQHHDERGIRWPRPITPFHAIVTPVNMADATVTEAAERIHDALEARGLDVLLDDRDIRPGPKFKDADLIGVPVRVTVGERHLRGGNVEVYDRIEDRVEIVALDAAADAVVASYDGLGA